MAAAKDAKQQVLEYAADLLDVPAEKLDMKDSEVFVAQGSDEKRISLKEIAYHAHLRNKQFIGCLLYTSCTGYVKIEKAVEAAAQKLQERG